MLSLGLVGVVVAGLAGVGVPLAVVLANLAGTGGFKVRVVVVDVVVDAEDGGTGRFVCAWSSRGGFGGCGRVRVLDATFLGLFIVLFVWSVFFIVFWVVLRFMVWVA